MKRTPILYVGPVDIEGEGVYSIVAQAAKGFRFVLRNYGVEDKARADRMAARIKAVGSIDVEQWNDHWPEYGSEAYEAEAADAYLYAEGLRGGFVSEADIPDNIRTLL
jgi:hypothetical protein